MAVTGISDLWALPEQVLCFPLYINYLFTFVAFCMFPNVFVCYAAFIQGVLDLIVD
jgi:hypothetical protein